jgi:cysteine desulfurase/selenocysteine lyase
MVDRVTLEQTSWQPLPGRLEAGSPNTEGIIGLSAALSYLESTGWEQIQDHTVRVSRTVQDMLKEVPGISLLGEPDPASGTISFTHTSIHPHDLAQVLADNQICVRAGYQCAQPLHAGRNLAGSLRVSIGLYNSEEDGQKLIEALTKALEIFHA